MTIDEPKKEKNKEVVLSVDDYADHYNVCKAVEENLKVEAGLVRASQLVHELGFKELCAFRRRLSGRWAAPKRRRLAGVSVWSWRRIGLVGNPLDHPSYRAYYPN